MSGEHWTQRSSGKLLQVVVAWLLLLGGLALAWAPALRLPQLWLVVAVSVLANLLQPAYQLLEGSRTREDRGTAVQIVWSVYVSQIAALVELAWRRRAALPMDLLAWSALAVMVGGLALRTWAVVTLGRFFTWNVEVQNGQRIVESGPYRFLRHPSYTGAWLTFVASPILLHSWVAASLAALALALAFRRRTRYEEKALRVSLPEYQAYADRTGRFVPRLFRRGQTAPR